MKTPIDEALIDAAMADTTAITGIPVADIIEAMRGPMVVFGDYIGVDLRGASADIVREFSIRTWILAAERRERFYRERGSRMTPEEWTWSEETDAIMNDAALQAVQELFGGAEKAS